LRSSSNFIDVQVIANGMGGGGHKQAAGFSSELSADELVEYITIAVTEQLQQG
jgi:phosphoesterase RecJ-like protein